MSYTEPCLAPLTTDLNFFLGRGEQLNIHTRGNTPLSGHDVRFPTQNSCEKSFRRCVRTENWIKKRPSLPRWASPLPKSCQYVPQHVLPDLRELVPTVVFGFPLNIGVELVSKMTEISRLSDSPSEGPCATPKSTHCGNGLSLPSRWCMML